MRQHLMKMMTRINKEQDKLVFQLTKLLRVIHNISQGNILSTLRKNRIRWLILNNCTILDNKIYVVQIKDRRNSLWKVNNRIWSQRHRKYLDGNYSMIIIKRVKLIKKCMQCRKRKKNLRMNNSHSNPR